MAEIPVVLLAAGHSERMGQAKQLLPWGENTLIEHQIGSLLKTGQPLLVVLGSRSEQILPLVEKFHLDIVVNREWERGMGSSIAAGMNRVTDRYPGSMGVLIALVDQPLVPPDHYRMMLQAFQPETGSILASRSKTGLKGVPALFDAAYFRELAALDGAGGAKHVIRAHSNKVVYVDCDEMGEDLDTPEDYRRLHAIWTGKLNNWKTS